MLQPLQLTKPGVEVPKLQLNLSKPEKFTVELYWDSAEDLDAHALLATNSGQGAKITSFDQCLSTYNSKKTNPAGSLVTHADGSFSTPEGAATHSGDARSGIGSDIDEIITIDGSKIPAGVNEIPIFITIHPSGKTNFGAVKDAGMRIKNSAGKILGEFQLTNEYASFDAVQMGTLELDSTAGWLFSPAGSGFNGDFNAVIGFFS